MVLSGFCTCQPCLQTSHRPNRKMLVDMSISILIFDDGCCLDLPVSSTCHLRLKHQNFPSPGWDFHMFFALCLQGGGVYIGGGTVTFSSCTITGNTADNVRALAQKFPSPRWDFHMFCACVCRAAVSMSRVARRPSHRAPSLATQLTMCVLMFESSHRPFL